MGDDGRAGVSVDISIELGTWDGGQDYLTSTKHV